MIKIIYEENRDRAAAYDGSIENVYFQSTATEGDGSIGMQFSKPVGKITIGKK